MLGDRLWEAVRVCVRDGVKESDAVCDTLELRVDERVMVELLLNV
jgi:hypothetical protein